MTKLFVSLIFTFLSFTTIAQSPIGAWEAISKAQNGDELKTVVIFTDGYQVLSIYNLTTGKFISCNGGTWKLNGDTMTEKKEFDTNDSKSVGTEVSFKIVITDQSFQIVGSKMKLKRVDDGKPGALQGAWLMSGRVTDGKEQTRDTSGPRKTMKILSGTKFQWIAYNTETKQFLGTGGGNYSSENGEYVENIEFFSKDDTKVGMSIKFNYKLIDGKWHHSGFSSKGDPIYEIWSIRE
ncbi:hypothetical protein [Pedobacter alpinus]|uniref:Membrane or secreted protein n=1 Tax=Pedobacter alpinus TaxID=1590643 RepID=A0ABW5TRE2_9SPHI